MNNEDKKEDKENKKEKEEKISTNKIENEKSEITIKQQKIDIDELWNKSSLYKLNYTNILNQIKKGHINTENTKEYFCNILLMPLKIDLSDKVSTLNLLSNYYKRRKNSNLIYQIINKFDKNLEALIPIEPALVVNVFVRGMEYLKMQKNYIYSYKFLLKTKTILEKNAVILKKYNMDSFENFCDEVNADYIKNIIIYTKKFTEDESFKDEDIQRIKNIIDLLIDDKYIIDEGNEYLYVINKKWVVKAKSFIENYIKAKKDNIKNFFEEAFEPQFIYESYFDIKDEKKEKDKNNNNKNKPKLFFAFPGPINNFELTAFKDYWFDSINFDENDFMKKDVKLNEDYFLINEKDWKLLSDIFGYTNDIKRKKDSLDLLPLKFILFDRRINSENDNTNLLKQKYILINKNITMKELKQKIIRVTNLILNIDMINEINEIKIKEKEKKNQKDNSEKSKEKNVNKTSENKKEKKEESTTNENKEGNQKKENEESKKKTENIDDAKTNENKLSDEHKESKENEENKENNDGKKEDKETEEKADEKKNQNKEKEITNEHKKQKTEEGQKTENDSENKIKDNKEEPINKIIENPKQFNISFFTLDKNKKDLLIEMALSLIISLHLYDSLFIDEIPQEEIDDSKPLTNLLNIYNPEKQILLIDLYSTKESKFLFDIKKVMKNNYKCSLCSKPIDDLKNRYVCEICNYSLFCSKECSAQSKQHSKLNRKLFSIKDKKFVFTELLSMNLDEMLSKYTNHGRVGLGNMGNTCYMNSALQCLSNTEDLTKYFLYRSFKTEINNASSLSSKGLISKAYYNLIDRLWNEPKDKFLPKEFRITFCKKTGLFMNSEQQDSQEFLLALLDNLHEDLNRITNKKYMELEEQRINETDDEASLRWWNYYKSRENSIIVDLFQGQYKSTIKCLHCGKTSTSYDTYMSLGLPIPSQKTQIQIKLLTENLNFIDLNIRMNEDLQIKDIIKKATNFLDKGKYKEYLIKQKKDNIKSDKELEISMNILYNNIEIIEFNDNFKIMNILKTSFENINNNAKSKDNVDQPLFDNLRLSNIYKNNYNSELILFEKNITIDPNNNINIYIYPITTKKIDGIFSSSNKDIILSYPIIFSIKKEKSLEELETLIRIKFQPFLKLDTDIKEYLEICYPHFNKEWGKLKISENICPICNKKYDSSKKYCLLTNKKILISDLISQQAKRPLILFAKSQIYKKNKEFYKGIPLFNEKSTAEIKNSRNNLSVYDAFDLFNKEEFLEGDNQWYCNKCKTHQNAAKKIEIYKTPLYLIVQLKRFKQRNNIVRFILGSKNSTYIDYKEVLNLKDFVVGPDKDKSVYDLYAITIHREFMNGGHYYAYCKNRGIWVTFDDEKVSKCENPISKDAYLLFYKRKYE